MNDNGVRSSYHSAVSPSGHPGRFHPDAAARDAIPRLAPGAALIVTLLLSIGFWGASWLAVSALAAMWPWTVFCAKRKRSRNGAAVGSA